MRITLLATAGLAIGLLACADTHTPTGTVEVPELDIVAVPPLFQEDFESGTLARWDDGADPSFHRIITDPALAHSGSRALAVTYPPGGDGSWLTKFLLPGHESVHVSYWIRFPTAWRGGGYLLGVYGSRLTNQWSAHGKAGVCPTGDDFFSSFVFADDGDPGPVRFSTYHVNMPRTGTQCWGDEGVSTVYQGQGVLTRDAWHHVEFFVQANTPGQANGVQRFWIDGTLRGEWTGLRFRNTTNLAISSIQLALYSPTPIVQTQTLYVDDVVVTQVAPATIASIGVTPAAASLAVGSSAQLTATALDAGGAVVPATFAWSSSNPSAVTVTSTGLATAIAPGIADVSATASGISGRSTITVSGATPVASVSVVPGTGSVQVGQSLQFVATPRDAAGNPLAGRTVAWTSSDPAVATVDVTGRAVGVSAGTTVLRATSEGQNGTASLTVTAGPPPGAPVASITITPPSASVAVGQSIQLIATTRDAAGNVLTGRPVKWYTNQHYSTVDNTGQVTGRYAGNAQIVAVSEGHNVTAFVTVTDPPPPLPNAPVASITITPPFASVAPGQSIQLTATTHDAAGNVLIGRPVTWYTNQHYSTVDNTGRVTGHYAGSAQIVAVSEGHNVTAFVTVTEAPPPPPPPPPPPNAPVASITITPASSSVAVGQSIQLSATLRDAAGNVLTGRPVTWYTNQHYSTVDNTGRVTGRYAGSAQIVAVSEGHNVTAFVTVTDGGPPPPAPVASVAVAPATASIGVGQTVQLAATLRDAAGNVLTGRTISWSSATPAVAVVSSSGVVTAVAAGGPVTITATSEGRSGTAAVTVTAPPPPPPPVVTQIILTPASVSLATGATQQFTATAQMSNGTQQPAVVTWTATGGTVSGAGLYTAGSTAGSYRVIATQQGGTLADTAAITLTTAPPPPPGGSLAWFEDFRLSLTDKGMTQIASNATINRIPKSSATGTWPSQLTHVAENVYVAEMNAAYQALNLWPAPAVGQYLFGRMLLNNSLPNGANTGGDHGFQSNVFHPIVWFWRIWGGDADSFTLEFTTWDNSGTRELQLDVPKDRVLRLEWRAQRTGTSTATVSARVYNNETGALLGEITGLGQSAATHFREFLFGMSGQAPTSFNGGSVYWGALAFRVSDNANDWIGAYPVVGVER